MNLLSRYIVSEFIRFFLLFLTAFITMTLVGNFFNNLGNVFKNWQSFLLFLKETGLLLPQLLELTVPVTVLLATIAAFSTLNRSSELLAMRASGMSTLQMLFPIFATVLLIALSNYMIQHPIHNWMQQNWTAAKTKSGSASPLWKTGDGEKLYYLGTSSESTRPHSLAIFRWSQSTPLRLLERITVQEGDYKEQWSFKGIQQYLFGNDLRGTLDHKNLTLKSISQNEIATDQVPTIASHSEATPHHQPFSVLYANILRLQKEGQNVLLHQVELFQKMAYPVQLLIMAMIGISLALPTNRKGKAAEALAVSGFLGIVFWMMNQIMFALGASGLIPPFLGAWGSNLLFFMIACALSYSNR